MAQSYDCIVVGVGGFGSGALYHLARRGLNVLGLEQFDIAHDRGSSHGETRIIRKAYFEHPDYVPLLLRAYELWAELERETQNHLYEECGLMLAGPPEGEAIAGARLAARLHGLTIENLSVADAATRFPGFSIPENFDVVFEAEAGYLHVEECVQAHIEVAKKAGAVLHTGEIVQSIAYKMSGREWVVETDREKYVANSVVVTAGPWASRLLGNIVPELRVVRKPLFWFETVDNSYQVADGAPTYFFEMPDREFYGFPCFDGQLVKLAEHSCGEPVDDPSQVDRDAHASDIDPVSEFVRAVMPKLKSAPVRHAVCMYTHSADHHFIVDKHPLHQNLVIGAGFSGHGFKFTSVLGEALADLAADGSTKLPIDFLSLRREALQPEL